MSMPRSTLQPFRPALLGALLSVVSVFTLSACRQEAPAGEPPASGQPAVATPAPDAVPAPDAGSVVHTPAAEAAPAVLSSLSVGMAYADLRQALLADGWLPLRDPECPENVGGPAMVCSLLPETESCSGDGYCRMHFGKAPNLTLAVTAYGSYSAWDQPGPDSAFQVKSFDASSIETAAAQCPSQDFDGFLRDFATDPAVQRSFTAPLVRVAELEDRGDEGYSTRMVYQTADTYRDFNLKFASGDFHFVDSIGQMDPKPLRFQVKTEADGSRLLSYSYNLSEGNSYRFRKAGDCWSLSEDPEPPSP